VDTREQQSVDNLERLNAAARKLSEIQKSQLVVDLDAAWAEHEKVDRPIVFRFQGAEYQVPSSMPADFGRFYRRHCLRPGKDANGDATTLFVIPDGDLMWEFFETLAGADFSEAFSKTRIPLKVLMESVIGPIMREWGLFVTDEAAAESEGEKKSLTNAS